MTTDAYIIGEDLEYDPILFPREEREGSYINCYRYMDGYWIDSLENAHIKLSLANDFNDVFDCAGRPCVGKLSPEIIANHWKGDPVLRTFFELHGITNLWCYDHRIWAPLYSEYLSRCIQDKTMVGQFYMLCFSSLKSNDNEADILMWSHYTKKWDGVRLGFDLLFENHKSVTYNVTTPYCLRPVTYDKNRPCLNMDEMSGLSDATFLKYYIALCHTKSQAWSYENEWRLSVLPENAEVRYDDKLGRMLFWQFHKSLLKTIDIGPKVSSVMRSEIISKARRVYPDVTIRDAVPDCNKYKINYIEIG